MDEFLDDADFYDSDDFENSSCIVNISRYNNIDDDLDAGDAPEFETEEKLNDKERKDFVLAFVYDCIRWNSCSRAWTQKVQAGFQKQ